MASHTLSPSRPPAIVQKGSGRPDLLHFEVLAKIHRDDIERMASSVDAAIDAFGKVDILLVFSVYQGATLGAIIDAKATKVGLKSSAHVRRYGVVGAPGFADAMINLFDPVSPVDARTFAIDEVKNARAWMDNRHAQ